MRSKKVGKKVVGGTSTTALRLIQHSKFNIQKMAVNKNALIRYRTIDACLRRRHRKWTLEDLVEACSEALYEFEGIRKGVSVRSVQLDIQMMRSDRMGYNAPIVVRERKFYAYDDPEYSISKIPLTRQDLAVLGEVSGILQQFKGFSHFREVEGMVNRLEQKVAVSKSSDRRSAIDFEKNDDLVGLDFLAPLLEAVQKEAVLAIRYRSFKGRAEQTILFHPHLLKEYRNRWFLLGRPDGSEQAQLLALDRILGIEKAEGQPFRRHDALDASFFGDLIGVTKNLGQRPARVVFWADAATSPYIMTKPLHSSQVLERTDAAGGTIFSIQVVLNFELEREFLGFGERVEVLSPRNFRGFLEKRLAAALARYAGKTAAF